MRSLPGAGAFPFELSVPGAQLPCAGVTVVGVLPTHRRQGILGRMMRTQLADIRERGEPIAALWASEETIYGRFGYGLAAQDVMIRAARVDAALQPDLPGRTGTTRLVGHDEALRVFPRIYDRVRRDQPGFISRSKPWWELRKLDDRPERRRGAGELNRVLLEIDGKPVGYATYRIKVKWDEATNKSEVHVLEAIGDSPVAVRELWRYLLAIDWVTEIHCDALLRRPPAVPPRAAAEQPQVEGLRRPLAAPHRPRRRPLRAIDDGRRPRHVRRLRRPDLPRQRRRLDGGRRRCPSLEAARRHQARRPGARVCLPRWVHVRRARRGRDRGRKRSRAGASPGRMRSIASTSKPWCSEIF